MIEEGRRPLNGSEKEALNNWQNKLERTVKARKILFILTLVLLSLIVTVSVFVLRDGEYNKLLLFLGGTVLLYLGLTFWSNRQQYLASNKLIDQIKYAIQQNEARVITISCQKAFLTKHDFTFGYLFLDEKSNGFFIENDAITQQAQLPNSDFDIIQVFDEEDNLLDIFTETRGIALESLEVEEEVLQKILKNGNENSDKGYLVTSE